MLQMPRAAFVIGLALLLMLSACGFKLRGSVELPLVLQDTYIESENPFTGMARTLRQELEIAGANIVRRPECGYGYSGYPPGAHGESCVVSWQQWQGHGI